MLSDKYLSVVKNDDRIWEIRLVMNHLGKENFFKLIPMASAYTKDYTTSSSYCRIIHIESNLLLGAFSKSKLFDV